MKYFTVANLILLTALSSNCSRKTGEDSVKNQQVHQEGLSGQGSSIQQTAPETAAVAPTLNPVAPTVPSVPSAMDARQEATHKTQASVEPQANVPPACLTFAFHHQAGPKHVPGPDCAHHKNRVTLPEEFLDGSHDLKQLCVRVDGVPVVFVREGKTITLGAAPRSRSLISVRACRKGATCVESCKIPKDELMNELAGESADAAAGWDEDSAVKVTGAIDDEIKKELASLDDEEISKDWTVEGQPTELQSLACAARAGRKSVASKSVE